MPEKAFQTEHLTADAAGIARAAQLLGQGLCVAFPTETVYGLGADARDSRAVAGIYAAKDRPSFNPLIVHVASLDQALRLAVFDDQAERLAAAFWPGALTLVLPLRPGAGLSDLVTAGLATVGLRMPAHPVAQALLAAFDGPVAAPSANPSGRISPTRAAHVAAGLDGRIAAILDGGGSPVGLESTILAPGTPPRLLRPGGIPPEAIAACLGQPLAAPDGPDIAAPGMMDSHYAPAARVRLNAITAQPGEWLIGFGAVAGDDNLSLTGDLAEAASALFAALHRADASTRPIAVAPIPDHGLGLAINDRLRRAAAPRG
ncbi:L-threonylcarbamoyladenylate synthase [Paracoccus sp. p4-l81]|uniref:L-threonylcarbamoyladenylate synthase n=1 Tax=unclassified Paracoccus (in: a-proteobacteria) TaxID=2688777 RepID=UPI0035B99A46